MPRLLWWCGNIFCLFHTALKVGERRGYVFMSREALKELQNQLKEKQGYVSLRKWLLTSLEGIEASATSQ